MKYRYLAVFFAGIVFGEILRAPAFTRAGKRLREFHQSDKMKTDLLNWVIANLFEMEPEAFIEEFKTRGQFINLVVDIETTDPKEHNN